MAVVWRLRWFLTDICLVSKPDFTAGMLVQTYRREGVLAVKCGIYVRRSDSIFGSSYEHIGNIPHELGFPSIYLGVLPEDRRFAEILRGDQIIAVLKEILVKYE